jgi:hypothetical protein
LRAVEVERWADAVEGRDEIGFETGYEEALKSTAFTRRSLLARGEC